jgi:hypothetical protein
MPPFFDDRESITHMFFDIEPKSVHPAPGAGSVAGLQRAACVINDVLDGGKPSASITSQFIE